MKAAVIGGGVIGGGWAARFLLNGWNVTVYDPAPDAQQRIDAVLANARRSLPALHDAKMPDEGALRFAESVTDAVRDAAYIQESVPERLKVKHRVLGDIQAHAPADAVLGSSTSGFTPTQLQKGAARPEQILVCHPFNPVYLLPLVEVVASDATSAAIRDRCMEILDRLGMKPLLVRKEIDAHIADRLMEAVWREGLWLIHDGIATTEEIDDAIRFGFGLRWAQMGLFETFRIAGGEDGMRHFLAQFGPALKWPWTKLMDVPELTDQLVDTIAAQSDAQSGRHSIQDLERLRDDNLVGILWALKQRNWGAGALLNAQDGRLVDEPGHAPGPTQTVCRQVPRSWIDYNGHLNEAHYLELFSQATDRFMELIGADQTYVASGLSYFTVETHLRHLDEVLADERVQVRTQVLDGNGKKMHLFHWLETEDGREVATAEHMLIHVDLKTRSSCPPTAAVTSKLAAYAARHAGLPRPQAAGRGIGRNA